MKSNTSKYLIKNTILWKNLSAKSLFVFFVLALSIAFCVQGEVTSQEHLTSASSNRFKVTFDPPAENMPRSSMGGASRTISQCVNQTYNSDLPFSALLPASTQGLTTAPYPTILAYLPETSAENLFFSWRNEDNQDHYQAILPIEKQGGIISLSLSENAPPLEVAKNYQWALGIMCDGRLQPDSPMIQGQVKRIELASSVQNLLDDDISLKNAALYGENGLWYDTVATLAQLKTAQPGDRELELNWDELLNSVGLAEISEAPLNVNNK